MNRSRSLIAIGYWYSVHEPDFPRPSMFINSDVSQELRDFVALYLSKGYRLHEWMGWSPCRFGCQMNNGNACLSDGIYIWPEGLSHYITEHNVWLPQTFIDHTIKNQSLLTDKIIVPESEFGDYTWWKGAIL